MNKKLVIVFLLSIGLCNIGCKKDGGPYSGQVIYKGLFKGINCNPVVEILDSASKAEMSKLTGIQYNENYPFELTSSVNDSLYRILMNCNDTFTKCIDTFDFVCRLPSESERVKTMAACSGTIDPRSKIFITSIRRKSK